VPGLGVRIKRVERLGQTGAANRWDDH
jgi:hypothetical protein